MEGDVKLLVAKPEILIPPVKMWMRQCTDDHANHVM